LAFAADIADDLEAAGELDLAHLTQGGVRFLGRRGVHAGAHATALRAGCGQAFKAGTLLFSTGAWRGLRISWLIVGMSKIPKN